MVLRKPAGYNSLVKSGQLSLGFVPCSVITYVASGANALMFLTPYRIWGVCGFLWKA